MTGDSTSRRRFLVLAGTACAGAIAGCSGGGDGNGSDLGPVPSEYETATSIGGTQRDPESLSTKNAVDYQSSPNAGNQCSGCTFYIEDIDGDGVGACAIVEGEIEPEGWCASFAPHQG
jgi:hypothetical protein